MLTTKINKKYIIRYLFFSNIYRISLVIITHKFFFKTILINPAYTVYEIKRQLENTEAQAIFTFPAKYADIIASIKKNSKIK